MTSVGEILRLERERQGHSLREIADSTKIASRYLTAIETDDRKTLPGSFFYKSFVRQYATALRLDEQEIEAHLRNVVDDIPASTLPGDNLEFPLKRIDPIVAESGGRSPSERRWVFSLAALVVVLGGCSLIYGWWHNGRTQAVVASNQPSSVPPPVLVPKQPEPVPAKTAQSTPEQPPPPATLGQPVVLADGQHIVLDVSATETTWISIVSDGKQLFSGVLERSESRTLQGRDTARIRVGNAAGIEVRLNGKPLGPLGPRGQVRIVQITKDNFQILAPNSTL